MSRLETRKRAGCWLIEGWHVEKRGAYWGAFRRPSDRPVFTAKTLRDIRAWVDAGSPTGEALTRWIGGVS